MNLVIEGFKDATEITGFLACFKRVGYEQFELVLKEQKGNRLGIKDLERGVVDLPTKKEIVVELEECDPQ